MRIYTLAMLLYTILSFFSSLFAQPPKLWRAVEQAPLGIGYELPRIWYMAGFMSGKACGGCEQGTLNSDSKTGINMVIFKSQDLEKLKKQTVWGYTFLSPSHPTATSMASPEMGDIPEPSETPKTTPETLHPNRDFFGLGEAFAQTVSVWKEDKNLQVIRIICQQADDYFLIYFWAPPAVIQSEMPVLERITKSFRFLN
jgi:hypothetical protein